MCEVGDMTAVGACWSYFDADQSGSVEGAEFTKCQAQVTAELLEHIDDLPPDVLKKLAKAAISGFVNKTLDPNTSGKITKDEFEGRLHAALTGVA